MHNSVLLKFWGFSGLASLLASVQFPAVDSDGFDHPQISEARYVIANFMNNELDNFKVTDRQTFIKFLDLLHTDFINNPESWENKTLIDFLEALSAYAEDIQGCYNNMKLNKDADKPDWSTFADILRGASIYE